MPTEVLSLISHAAKLLTRKHPDPERVPPRVQLVLELLDMASDAVVESDPRPTPLEIRRVQALAARLARPDECELRACGACGTYVCVNATCLLTAARHPGRAGLGILSSGTVYCSDACRTALPDAPQGDPAPCQEAVRAREVAEVESGPARGRSVRR